MVRSLFTAGPFLCFTIFSCLLSACATPGPSGYQYRDPLQAETVTNEAVVRLPFSDTWDRLIGQLAKSFFVINNVEKASRMINVSFSTDKPEEYVDCGTSERTFQYAKESQTYRYPVAGSSTFKALGHWNNGYYYLPLIDYMSRKLSLEGRINISVAPKEQNTIVTVNTRYILTARVSGQRQLINGYGVPFRERISLPETTDSVSFNTGQIGSADWGGEQEPQHVKCRSTGKIETEILAMTKR